MEQNLPVLPKKVWSLLRIFYYMLRKGISKKKLWLDLNMMMKRAKILGKNLQNLMFHHHHHWAAFATNSHPSRHLSVSSPPSSESEFSCTASPSNDNDAFSLFPLHKKDVGNGRKNQQEEGVDVMAFNAAVLKAMETIQSETASPALPGFGRSPMVRQLRVTDSPFPITCVDEDHHVDQAAEQFISRFYNHLRRQNMKAPLGSCSPME